MTQIIDRDNLSFSELDQILAGRGILEVAQKAGWRSEQYYGRDGWAYPVVDYATGEIVAQRWKAAPDQSRMKYGWIPGKPDNSAANWYILPGTAEAIAAADGVAYLANGEPGLLAYHAAGVCNVIATTLSEVGVPKDVVEVLQALGISRLIYPVDNDPPSEDDKLPAGEQSAINWRDALRGSGIDYEPLSWGPFAPDKADANDMWMLAEFEPAIFEDMLLKGTEALVLPAPVISTSRTFNDSDFDQTPEGLINAIVSHGRHIGYSGHGDWINGKCLDPNHTDKNDSAGINTKSGAYNCFVCGGKSVHEMADYFGINWRDYYPKRDGSKTSKLLKPDFSTDVPVDPDGFVYLDEADQKAFENRVAERRKLNAERQEKIVSIPSRPQFDNRGLPDNFIRAATLAAGGKSDLGLMISKILSLPDTEYTMHELAEHTGYSYRTIKKWVNVLIDLFVLKEEGNELDPLDKSITTKGSIRSLLIIRDRSDIAAAILQAIECRLIESKFKNHPARPTLRMAAQIGADGETFDAWKAMYIDALDSKQVQQLEAEVKRELDGSNSWRGWRILLHDSSYDTFSYSADTLPDSISVWRVETMQKAVDQNDTRLNSEWQRLLGTFSKGTVLNIRKKCNLKTVQNKPEISDLKHMKRHVLEDPDRAVDVIYDAMRQAERKHGAPVVACKIHTAEGEKYFHDFAKGSPGISYAVNRYAHNGTLRGIEFTLQGASTYEPAQYSGYEDWMAEDTEWGFDEEYQPSMAKQTIIEVEEAEEVVDIEPENESNVDEELPPVTEYDSNWLRANIANTYREIVGVSPEPGTSDLERLEEALACWQAKKIRLAELKRRSG